MQDWCDMRNVSPLDCKHIAGGQGEEWPLSELYWKSSQPTPSIEQYAVLKYKTL